MPNATALVRRLRQVGSDLSADLAAQIVATGREAAPLLRDLLATPMTAAAAAVEDAECPDCGQQHDDHEWARLHAVDLLTELRDHAAIALMLELLAATPSDEPLHDKIVERLPLFGGDALDPILAALEQHRGNAQSVESLCCMLAALGVRDARVLHALGALLEMRPRAAAYYLTEYGDPAACAPLLQAIEARAADGADPAGRAVLPDLVEAFAALGGELPPDVSARLATVRSA